MKRILLALCLISVIIETVDAQIDTSAVVYAWQFDNHLSNRLRVPVDTLLNHFHQQHPLLPATPSVSATGNYGRPVQSNVFADRPNKEFLLYNPFLPFMKGDEHSTFYFTRKPFTQVAYLRGGTSQSKEEILDAFHTQNLTKQLNVGGHFTTFTALGQYSFQRVKSNSFRFFSNLSGNLYSFQMQFYINRIVADENGGVLNDSLITDSVFVFNRDIPTLFSGIDNPPRHIPDVSQEIRNMGFMALQELAFRPAPPDSSAPAKPNRIFYPKLIHIIRFNRTIREFNDLNPTVGLDANLYPNAYISEELTHDSLRFFSLGNALRIQFQGRVSNLYFIDLNYDIARYDFHVASNDDRPDSLRQFWFISDQIRLPGIQYSAQLQNTYLSSGFSRAFLNHAELSLFGKIYLAGYRSGDLYFSGNLRLFTGKNQTGARLILSAENAVHTPDFLYTRYASNHFIWTNRFNRTLMNHLSISLGHSSNSFDAKADYYLLRNFIYMNDEAVPDIYKQPLSILSLSLYKQFRFRRVGSDIRLVYQKCDNQRILGLPDLAVYASTYLTLPIHFRATGGNLLTMTGFDMFYNTSYFADAYMPATSSFHRQQVKKLGNYPYFDLFINVQLKRLRFFLKSEHLNSGWLRNNYFTVLHYPMNTRSLKFGFSWTFYD